MNDKCKELASEHENVNFMLDNRIDFQDEKGTVRVLGSTLWTDYDNRDPMKMEMCRRIMNDHSLIEYGKRLFFPKDAADEHDLSVDFLVKNLIQLNEDRDRVVVMTHHLPTYQAVNSVYSGSRVNCAYASELFNLIAHNGPTLWVFGHQHRSTDIVIGETWLRSNPYGYHGYERNRQFNSGLVLEV